MLFLSVALQRGSGTARPGGDAFVLAGLTVSGRFSLKPPMMIVTCSISDSDVFYICLQGAEMDDLVKRLEDMLAKGQNNAMLRLSLGKAYTEREQFDIAVPHLRAALELDPQYSVVWKWLGKALQGQGDNAAARQAWQSGVETAQARGDQQVVKELQVFIKRLDRAADM